MIRLLTKNKWMKFFEHEEYGPVLVIRTSSDEYDDDCDNKLIYYNEIRYSTKELLIGLKIGYASEEKRNEYFDKGDDFWVNALNNKIKANNKYVVAYEKGYENGADWDEATKMGDIDE